MTKSEVTKFKNFGPYKDVSDTYNDGLVTLHGVFNARKTTISFVFYENELDRITYFIHEGRNIDEAVNIYRSLFMYIQNNYGKVHAPQISFEDSLTLESFTIALKRHLNFFPLAAIEMYPKIPPKEVLVSSAFHSNKIKGSISYSVFLSFKRP